MAIIFIYTFIFFPSNPQQLVNLNNTLLLILFYHFLKDTFSISALVSDIFYVFFTCKVLYTDIFLRIDLVLFKYCFIIFKNFMIT